MENNIQSILKQMTLEEKAALCTGASAWTTTPIKRLGIPEIIVSDGPHGIRRVADADSTAIKSLAATCFPTASGTASIWNTDLIHQIGQAIAEEAIALKVDVVFGEVNPSGKLAETFPLRLEDTPAYLNFPGDLDEVCYGEGLFIGYRCSDARQQPVLFPFGYGKSYTTFAYSAPRVSSRVFRNVEDLTVSVNVTNT